MDKYQRSQKNRLFKTEFHDPFASQRFAGSAICPGCEAFYHSGNWKWRRPEALTQAPRQVTCPACRRIADNMPAGVVTLSGKFWAAHRDAITHLVYHAEKLEKSEHALERLLSVEEKNGDLVVSTTGLHLAGRIAHALRDAFKGEAHYHYNDDTFFLSVTWRRND